MQQSEPLVLRSPSGLPFGGVGAGHSGRIDLFEPQLTTIDTPGELQIGEAGRLVVAIPHQASRYQICLIRSVEGTGDNPVGHAEQELRTAGQRPAIQDLKRLDVGQPMALASRAQSELAFQDEPMVTPIIQVLDQQGLADLAWMIQHPPTQDPDRSGKVVVPHFTGTCSLDAQINMPALEGRICLGQQWWPGCGLAGLKQG
jgi:hypothetical protein